MPLLSFGREIIADSIFIRVLHSPPTVGPRRDHLDETLQQRLRHAEDEVPSPQCVSHGLN
jgi:hypothetical protein